MRMLGASKGDSILIGMIEWGGKGLNARMDLRLLSLICIPERVSNEAGGSDAYK